MWFSSWWWKEFSFILLCEPVWYTSCEANVHHLVCHDASSTSLNPTKTQILTTSKICTKRIYTNPSREATVAEREYASIIYQGAPQLKGGMGNPGRENTVWGGRKTRGRWICLSAGGVSGALKKAFIWHTCMCMCVCVEWGIIFPNWICSSSVADTQPTHIFLGVEILKCGRKRKEKRSQINTAQSREGCHLRVNLLFPLPSCGVSFLLFFFFFATRRWHCLKKQPRGTSQQLRARRRQEVKCKRGPPLEEHASPRLSSLFQGPFSKDTVTQSNPLVSLTLSQPLRGSAHRHQHRARLPQPVVAAWQIVK